MAGNCFGLQGAKQRGWSRASCTAQGVKSSRGFPDGSSLLRTQLPFYPKHKEEPARKTFSESPAQGEGGWELTGAQLERNGVNGAFPTGPNLPKGGPRRPPGPGAASPCTSRLGQSTPWCWELGSGLGAQPKEAGGTRGHRAGGGEGNPRVPPISTSGIRDSGQNGPRA